MKKLLFPLLFAVACILVPACLGDTPNSTATISAPFSLITAENSHFKYENLRLYPVVASAELLMDADRFPRFKTLAEAMKTPGFRIMERKQFGRDDQAWYHGVTVQNKTRDTVLLLSGEIVKGGNQDRVIAHHEVILPKTVRNIEVFCVEAGRSIYYNQSAPESEKQVAAFNGYFSVASPQVRRAVQKSGNQQKVWDAVAEVTKANHAESPTQSYTALDMESAQKSVRDAYIRQLSHQFDSHDEVVGVVAVCGNQILGVDIFASPELFRSQYPALLHGYVAEAAISSNTGTISTEHLQHTFKAVTALTISGNKANDLADKYAWNGHWVHLYSK
jgi:hypothetical protein